VDERLDENTDGWMYIRVDDMNLNYECKECEGLRSHPSIHPF